MRRTRKMKQQANATMTTETERWVMAVSALTIEVH